jgi:hypothetical protein
VQPLSGSDDKLQQRAHLPPHVHCCCHQSSSYQQRQKHCQPAISSNGSHLQAGQTKKVLKPSSQEKATSWLANLQSYDSMQENTVKRNAWALPVQMKTHVA